MGSPAWDTLAAELEAAGARVRTFESSRVFRAATRLGWRYAGLTLGSTIWIREASVGTADGWRILRHEARHVRDVRRWGALAFYGSYLLPLPLGPLSLRGLWEWRAYVEDLRALHEAGEPISDAHLDEIVRAFTGRAYAWMFPFAGPLRRALARERDRIEHGSEAGPHGGSHPLSPTLSPGSRRGRGRSRSPRA